MFRLISFTLLLLPLCCLANGKILATPGVSQIEGSAGGGLVPWAQLAGYATEDEWAISGFCTQANVDDFELTSCGIQGNLYDRIELSYATQNFDVLPLSLKLSQDIYGAKVRLYGDLVYSDWPQLSLGVQYKKLTTPDIAYSLGAKDDNGTDIYIAMSKLHLGLLAGYNVLWNASFRYTTANEIGLLGFGGTNGNGAINAEVSVAVLLNNHLAIGTEYRQKPDNLGLKEDDWHDIFIAWFPNKHVSMTAAYINLGTIAGLPDQTGWYFSLTGYY
ncbi:DUF3034 family protein [Thalassotalea marina]|uniref:DUF3034 family protein n=1 Tax=Thalassotalea marina TaxID=1673741 RepID=A0A919EPA9_9GAMM|nr:DUF3034 family protein [Thalassotalea marina]GHG04768.1 hypothetical protein GCM10017161_37980 [Thalassotalea marina]